MFFSSDFDDFLRILKIPLISCQLLPNLDFHGKRGKATQNSQQGWLPKLTLKETSPLWQYGTGLYN